MVTTIQRENPNQKQGVQDPNNSPTSNPGIDPMLLAYLCIAESVQISSNTAEEQAKSLQINANNQNNLINQNNQNNFVTLPFSQMYSKKQVLAGEKHSWHHGRCYTKKIYRITFVKKTKVKATAIDQMQDQNDRISGVRNILEDKISQLSQSAQVTETNINTTANDSQENFQAAGGIMSMIQSLTQMIC